VGLAEALPTDADPAATNAHLLTLQADQHLWQEQY
jgi:hypothetical protein